MEDENPNEFMQVITFTTFLRATATPDGQKKLIIPKLSQRLTGVTSAGVSVAGVDAADLELPKRSASQRRSRPPSASAWAWRPLNSSTHLQVAAGPGLFQPPLAALSHILLQTRVGCGLQTEHASTRWTMMDRSDESMTYEAMSITCPAKLH